MISRLFAVALVSGLLAGLCAFLFQELKVTPLIHQAETYELAEPATDSSQRSSGGQDHSHDHDHEAWGPEDGWERFAFTLLTNLLIGFGYGLLLVAGYAFSGRTLDARQGLLWGLGGFAAVALAPALALPPELPGAAAGDLQTRQWVWIAAALSTAAGLAALALSKIKLLRLLGLLLLIVPIALPTPHGEGAGLVPPELAAHFVSASLVGAVVFWACLGALSGHLHGRWCGQN